jgi:hypothetical protein
VLSVSESEVSAEHPSYETVVGHQRADALPPFLARLTLSAALIACEYAVHRRSPLQQHHTCHPRNFRPTADCPAVPPRLVMGQTQKIVTLFREAGALEC